MRSVGAAALVFLAIATECLSAGSDRPRHRSGPIRSVPVGADVKRVPEFDCPEEFGYYPHPTDCTQYYVCVFGGALLESCTGGLMYSHELQTCDWPRNVGCDATSAVGDDDLVRLSEREPSQSIREREPPQNIRRNPPQQIRERDPPQSIREIEHQQSFRPRDSPQSIRERDSPRRTPAPPPPPPPRVQPNPVVTSRGQPKFSRDEYEKQQQLYAEVDDLPPVEEIESDRQQRVYRGQPSTIGQVQKDRDGYGSQYVESGRTLNSNVIPASVPQNSGKIGSFSYTPQIDDRRTATQAPQTYSGLINMTDSAYDRQQTTTKNFNDLLNTETNLTRKKRDLVNSETLSNNTESVNASANTFSKRSDVDDVMDYFEEDTVEDEEEEDADRDKRQIRFYVKNGNKNPTKNNPNLKKHLHFLDFANYPSPQVQENEQKFYKNYYETNKNPSVIDVAVQNDNSNQHFKPSLPDLSSYQHNPASSVSQIITKSPPISSLRNNENPFLAIGGFFNNSPKQSISQHQPVKQYSGQDSYQVPSNVVTGSPQIAQTSQRTEDSSKKQHEPSSTDNIYSYKTRPTYSYQTNEDEDSDEDELSEQNYKKPKNNNFYRNNQDFAEPPKEFTHPRNRYAEIYNPFANPNFDFDAFLAQLRGERYKSVDITTPRQKFKQSLQASVSHMEIEDTTAPFNNYKGMSTPRPFSVYETRNNSIDSFIKNENVSKAQNFNNHSFHQNNHILRQNQHPNYQHNQQSASTPLEAVRPKLTPPNFRDERLLPLTFSFNRPFNKSNSDNQFQFNQEAQQIYTVTQKPYFFNTVTQMTFSTPKTHYMIKPEKLITFQPGHVVTGRPFVSSVKPFNGFLQYVQSTPKPLTYLAKDQLAALQQFWNNNPTTKTHFVLSTPKPNLNFQTQTLSNFYLQTIKPTNQQVQTKVTSPSTTVKDSVSSTTNAPPKPRRPIPKPSPEMSDYYYDDDEGDQYYYEPPVKSKYMPISEVRPQRPHMSQNDEEYGDEDSYEDSEEISQNNKPQRPLVKRPVVKRPEKYVSVKPDVVTKNYNDVSTITKAPHKEGSKNTNGKIPVPVMVTFMVTPTPSSMRPQISNHAMMHHVPRNKTMHIWRPTAVQNGPNTLKPPKYLNQTTLRPYTVRHRLAKPTTVKDGSAQSEDNKAMRGKLRHQNIVVHMKFTTPRDSFEQGTSYKTRNKVKTSSLEPTDSATPARFSASPRPKMLYNASQTFNPDQYDPFYPVYDEDGELYRDTEYVQQYNPASLRPAVQQTYRGTPPPPPQRRPVEYSPRPSPDEYDDALVQGPIDNNQYQTPVRQTNRGEGNDLGYENISSSVKTTLFEATSFSTTPTTTSTSTTTTTQRPTTAQFTEAMTPSHYSTRSSTDENTHAIPETSIPTSSEPIVLSTPSDVSLSKLARPFEVTDNVHRLVPTESATDKILEEKQIQPIKHDRVHLSQSNENDKKTVSLTTGFSIRRNPENEDNPYTLTVLTRPLAEYNKLLRNKYANQQNLNLNVDSKSTKKPSALSNKNSFFEGRSSERRFDSFSESESDEDDLPLPIRPGSIMETVSKRFKVTAPSPTKNSTKYFLKTVIKRPAPFSVTGEEDEKKVSTELKLDTDTIIETALRNSRREESAKKNLPYEIPVSKTIQAVEQNDSVESRKYLTVSPFNSLNNLRKVYTGETTTTSTTTLSSIIKEKETEGRSYKPSYYTYRVSDDAALNDSSENFSSKVKNVIKAFFNNFSNDSIKKPATENANTMRDDQVVNIGFNKKPTLFNDKPFNQRKNRIQIISDPQTDSFVSSTVSPRTSIIDYKNEVSSTSTYILTPTENFLKSHLDTHQSVVPASKFQSFVTTEPKIETTTQLVLDNSKFEKIINATVSDKNNYKQSNNIEAFNDLQQHEPKDQEIIGLMTDSETQKPTNSEINDIASTTSMTKLTTTVKSTQTTLTKSLSFPTRASRVNPAIKLAATKPGGGRRSYQSSSNCSIDDSLQANPKCNEIKYQRPTSSRGRGTAHYTLNGSEAPPIQQTVNRGTPPTRSRPTLKPSTAIVSKSLEFQDIYHNPPSRPSPIYPQPTPDKTAAKCRKDVCLLPDCSCGGRDIPGDLPVESVPQIVLLTFDDSVNDLNKGLYTDLFEKGRVNPNGCPISATFYVSHEWTDYSQVQNLYSAGHEMASHTISHSFGEQFSQKKWNREVGGQREILAAYGGVNLEDVRGMRAPFLSVGGNKMFKMLYDSNFTYDSSMPVYENKPPSWPYTLDYKLFHDCMIPPCPTKSYPGVWEVPMVMWQDLNGGRCSMGDACANPADAEGVYKMILKNFDRHYTTNRAPFGLFYHAAWFTQPHHKAGFIMFLDFINSMQDVWIVTNWQALQWVRDPTPISRLTNFQPFQCNYQDRPKKCNNPKVCNLWHKSGVRYMRTCQPCPEIYPWTGKTGIRSSRIDNEIEE